MLIVHHLGRSQSERIVWLCEELGVDYELKRYERDPLMRPFAGNASIYAMTQITPTGLDFLSRRMLRSNNSVVLRFWWVPQTAFAAGSVWCGVRNLHVASVR